MIRFESGAGTDGDNVTRFEASPPTIAPELTAKSARYRDMLGRLHRLAPHDDVTVLFEGETGTGKSILARYLHDRSPRASRVFREVPLSSLDDALASSDLFGHRAGAFTDAKHSRRGHFASAAGGTLFLDEIGKATPAVQRKLLVAIERRESWTVGADQPTPLDIRILAASNVPLDQLVARGGFLPDLYARLVGFRIVVPPLRERRADIPLLARLLLERRALRAGYTRVPELSAGLLSALRAAEWPYNIRELDDAMHLLLVEGNGVSMLGLEHCVGDLAYLRDLARRDLGQGGGGWQEPLLKLGEPKSAAARRLGIARTTLYRRLKAQDGCADDSKDRSA